MRIPAIHLLALSALATATSALTAAPAHARTLDFQAPSVLQRAQEMNAARIARARDAARSRVADTPLCALDKETGAGMVVLKVPASVSLTLVMGLPHRFSLIGEEICGDRRDNNCDGRVDENCDEGDILPDSCGDGIVQQGEECDDGNELNNDGCSVECTFIEPEPRPEYWQAGFECEECMESECSEQAQACIDDPGCAAPRECVVQERCLSRTIASISCLCGSLSIPQCQSASEFPGACAAELVEGMGTAQSTELFANWIAPTTSAGRANFAFACMTRKCKSQCSTLFEAQVPARCGDGRLEANEECDDGNLRNGDGCSDRCTVEPPSCGDGDINQDSEECDDGNRIDDDACSNDCKINPGPVRGSWLAGPECDSCMRDRCEAQNQACLNDNECEEIRNCVGESMCMSSQLSSLSCLCGSLSVSECQRAENYPGACAEQFVLAVGDDNPDILFRDWIAPENAAGRANMAYTCMTRSCQEECSVLYKAKPAPTPVCGDGKLNPSTEECDDGNLNNGDGCSERCILEKPGSEDGFWLAGERCDTCMESRCESHVQGCVDNPQGCDAARICMGTANCSNPEMGPVSCLCGEGVSIRECSEGSELRGACALEMIEEESQGNPQRALARLMDLLNPASTANRAFVCMARSCKSECANNFGGSGTRPCGNGIAEQGEECDDGNTASGDGCSSRCQIEACGNARVDAGEQCDDGNTVSGDGCSVDCKIEGGCGNGLIDSILGESCDDGNTRSGDGCSSDCQLEKPNCGNAIIEEAEECDDGNRDDRDGCSSDCRIEYGPGPFGELWYSTIECDRCMFSECKVETLDCNTTQGCQESARCIGENNCLTRGIGPLSCFCGEQASITECTNAPLGTQQGECTAQMIEGIGASTTRNFVSDFLRGDEPIALAHRAYVCMSRMCPIDCKENFR